MRLEVIRNKCHSVASRLFNLWIGTSRDIYYSRLLQTTPFEITALHCMLIISNLLSRLVEFCLSTHITFQSSACMDGLEPQKKLCVYLCLSLLATHAWLSSKLKGRHLAFFTFLYMLICMLVIYTIFNYMYMKPKTNSLDCSTFTVYCMKLPYIHLCRTSRISLS